ncbi:cytochrome b5 domain-containing protein [Patescibacteria group bacterium]|nr:cytochrome b5 domain-containing protein [Patescibacteria group bacterium]MBU1074677.1 cytochrome b5 domain-containing protein [Patescibacteria group bacterium]MBU1951475.1 cytochrome b5 domain-containing protein [Patescibacteria group bacterium]
MKQENVIGIIGTILIIGLVAYFSFDYFNNQQPVVSSDANLNESTTITNTDMLTETNVARHSIVNDCWLIVNNKVYDVTNYLDSHPGGRSIIIPYCGKDATQGFANQGGQGSHSSFASSQLSAYIVGTL